MDPIRTNKKSEEETDHNDFEPQNYLKSLDHDNYINILTMLFWLNDESKTLWLNLYYDLVSGYFRKPGSDPSIQDPVIDTLQIQRT